MGPDATGDDLTMPSALPANRMTTGAGVGWATYDYPGGIELPSSLNLFLG